MAGKLDNVSPGELLGLVSDLSSPEFFWSDDTRREIRNNRTVPILVTPWVKGRPELEPAILTVTKDISKSGVCLVARQPIEKEKEVVISFWLDTKEMTEPWFFRANVSWCHPMATDLWNIGVKLDDFLNVRYARKLKKLRKIAEELLKIEKA